MTESTVLMICAEPSLLESVGGVAGSIEAFLPLYLKQVAEFTYNRAPYEVDARACLRR